MKNPGSSGPMLRPALSRFSAMLIEEAHDLTGLSYPALDEELGLAPGQSQRYSYYPMRPKTRAPHAAGIQGLENRVAKLLKRTAHKIVIENNSLLDGKNWDIDCVIGEPAAGLNLRHVDEHALQLGYEDSWPTYRRLKYSWPKYGIRLIDLYAWQWGILWDRGALRSPWTREAMGLPPDAPVESFLPDLVELAKFHRQEWIKALLAPAGNLPERAGDHE